MKWKSEHIPERDIHNHAVWKLTDEAVGNEGVLRNRKVKDVLSAGIIKFTSPVPPDEPAAKESGKFVSVDGSLLVLLDCKRI